ncbi:uncharacterized protein UDID_18024 [Ustilago sp. UG-2017a]|nr:uncharacterized protein UDID_18024 [Ustilago sp. UG-2017a]
MSHSMPQPFSLRIVLSCLPCCYLRLPSSLVASSPRFALACCSLPLHPCLELGLSSSHDPWLSPVDHCVESSSTVEFVWIQWPFDLLSYSAVVPRRRSSPWPSSACTSPTHPRCISDFSCSFGTFSAIHLSADAMLPKDWASSGPGPAWHGARVELLAINHPRPSWILPRSRAGSPLSHFATMWVPASRLFAPV